MGDSNTTWPNAQEGDHEYELVSQLHVRLGELVMNNDIDGVRAFIQEQGDEITQDAATDCEWERMRLNRRVSTRVVDSPLHHAASQNREEILRMLLATRADPNIRNDKMETPLHAATRSSHAQSVELLL